MAIKIEMLRCFAAVAQSGNLAAAAEKLGRTPSAISMMLKQFEDHLGAPLFEPGRKTNLTPLGDFTLAVALSELEHFEGAVASIQSFARADAGLVRVAAVPSVAASILPEALRRFLAGHPSVQVHVHDMDTAAVLRRLDRKEVELGYATMQEPVAGLRAAPLFSDLFGVLCTSGHALAEVDRPLEWSDLAPHRFIANGVCRQIGAQDFQAILARSQLTVQNTTSILAMVRAGVGVTVLPWLVVRDIGDDLNFAALADPRARRIVHTLRRAHAALPPPAQAFHGFVQAVAAEVAGPFVPEVSARLKSGQEVRS